MNNTHAIDIITAMLNGEDVDRNAAWRTVAGLRAAQGLVALQLFHGRTDPKQDMTDWGTVGPVFLVTYVHTTYGSDIKLGIPHVVAGEEAAGDGDLEVDDQGLVYYDGVWYGDWSVAPISMLPNLGPDRIQPFIHTKARRLAP